MIYATWHLRPYVECPTCSSWQEVPFEGVECYTSCVVCNNEIKYSTEITSLGVTTYSVTKEFFSGVLSMLDLELLGDTLYVDYGPGLIYIEHNIKVNGKYSTVKSNVSKDTTYFDSIKKLMINTFGFKNETPKIITVTATFGIVMSIKLGSEVKTFKVS